MFLYKDILWNVCIEVDLWNERIVLIHYFFALLRRIESRHISFI